MTRIKKDSTTSPAFCRCPRYCWRTTCRRREKISRLAVGDLTLHPAVDTYKYSKLLIQDDQMSDDLPFGSQGGAAIRYIFPLDGEYTIKVQLRRQYYDYRGGMGEPHQIDIRLDGVRIKRFTVGGEAKGMTMPENFAGNTQGSPEFEVYMHTADAGLEARIPVKAGEHEVSVSFVRRFWEPEGILQPPQIGFGRTTNEYYHGNPSVEFVYIGGPYGATTHGDSLSRRKVFVCTPKDAAGEEPCAKKILSTLAAHAYRRPLPMRTSRRCSVFIKQAGTKKTSMRVFRRPGAHPGGSQFFVPRRKRAAERGAWLGLPS